MRQLFTSDGQSFGVSASTAVLPMNIQDWFPLGWTGWISLQSKGLSRVFSNTTVKSINSSALSLLTSIHAAAAKSLQSCLTLCAPWTAARQAILSITNSQSLLKLMSIESVMPSNHLILCHPLLFLPSIFPSIRVFPNESVLHIRWPKFWSFSFSISPSNEYQEWFPLGWTGWISLQSKGLSRVFSNTTVKSINSSALSFLYSPTLTSIHDYWKNHSFDKTDGCWQNNVSAL